MILQLGERHFAFESEELMITVTLESYVEDVKVKILSG